MKNKWIYLGGMTLGLIYAAACTASPTSPTSEASTQQAQTPIQVPPRTAPAPQQQPIAPAPEPQRSAAQPGPAETRILGLLDNQSDAIVAPATVAVNQVFQAIITSTGSGCEREGDVGLVLSETSATVMVYDFTSATRPGIACTMILKRLPHTVNLSFSRPGEAVIRAWGRQTGPTTSMLGAPIILERRVLVQ